MQHNLSPNVKTVRVAPDDQATTTYTLAAGTDDKTSVPVDTAGFRGVRFLVLLGALVTAGTLVLSLQQSDDSDGSPDDFDDVAGSAITVDVDADDSKIAVLEVHQPLKRYVRVKTDRGTQNSALDGIVAELYGAEDRPVTQDDTVSEVVLLSSPAEGTP